MEHLPLLRPHFFFTTAPMPCPYLDGRMERKIVTELTGSPPVLLLDEVAAHLDARRRRALVDLIAALGVQAFMTGTDAAPFEAFAGEAEIITIPDVGRPDFREF